MNARGIGLVGHKCGMTKIFKEDGVAIPVTVIVVQPNQVVQIKNLATAGYCALQVTTGKRKLHKVTKPLAGHFKKANVEPGRGLWEFKLTPAEVEQFKVGDQLTVARFTADQLVDITGRSKGKGFAGVHKRHHFSLQYATHGNSLSHRAPGSIGQNQTPGRVIKGKKMAGHMGDKRVTVQSLKIIAVDVDKNLLLVQGAIPGAVNGDLLIRAAVKHKNKKLAAV